MANNLDIKDLSIIVRLFTVPRLDEWSKNMQVEGIETTDELMMDSIKIFFPYKDLGCF